MPSDSDPIALAAPPPGNRGALRVDSIAVIAWWYLAWTLATAAFTPLLLLAFRHFTDRGAAFGRPFAVLVLVWPAWFLSGATDGLIPFSSAALWVTLLVGGVASWIAAWRAGVLDRFVLTHVLLSEGAYLVLFLGYVWFRGYDPTIQWQEKLSDLMMLASTMRAESMPPPDAWLAGETINYYYVGYVPWAGMGKLVGTTPAIAYNLALASVFACTVMSAIGLAANIVGRYHSFLRARVAGALSAFFLVFMATPWATFTAIDRRATIWDDYWYSYLWDATRLLEGGRQPAITEFPAFSFQLGDLHPHLLALPYTILALATAWMLAILPPGQDGGMLARQWLRIALAGAVCGGLYAMNSWDMPAYLLVALIALVAGTSSWPPAERVGAATLLVVSAFAAWLPFHTAFEAPTAPAGTAWAGAVDGIPLVGNILASVMSWYGTATTVTQYTGLFGYAWIVGMALIGLELVRRRDADADPATTRILVAVSVATGLAGLLLPMPLLLMAAVPLGLVVLLVLRDARVTPANVALTLFAVGFALTLIPEFFYLLDVFNNRMNTVFKLYYQAWTMFALGAAIGAVVLWDALRRFTFTRIALPALAALMIAGGVGATAVGANQWLNWRPVAHNQGWIGMDGLHFLELDTGAEAAWAGEHAAITWLYEHARNGDVMLAAGGCEFTLDIGTTAAGSGVPTILGWEGHETQWHLGQEGFRQEIRQRVADINRMWETLDPDLLDQYGVTLLYVGPIEQRGPIYPNRETFTETCAPGPFASAADPAFPGAGWTQVYSNEVGVRIYRREDV